MKPDFDALFMREDVVGVKRLYSEMYFGCDFTPPPDEPWYAWRLPYKSPKGDLRPGGGIAPPAGFSAFAAERRRKAEARTGKAPESVFAIFLDAETMATQTATCLPTSRLPPTAITAGRCFCATTEISSKPKTRYCPNRMPAPIAAFLRSLRQKRTLFAESFNTTKSRHS